MSWKLTKKSHGILIWDDFKRNVKIMVNPNYHDNSLWDVGVFSMDEGRRGYPHQRLGVKKVVALGLAKKYRGMNWK